MNDSAPAPASSVLSSAEMILALERTVVSPELLLCLSLWRFTLSALGELGGAGVPLPTKKTLPKIQQTAIQREAHASLLSRLPSLTNSQLVNLLRQFTQDSQFGDDWQMSGKFPNSEHDVYEKWHTLHHSHTVHIIEAIVAELIKRGAMVSKRLLKKVDGSCVTFRDGALRFGSGRTLKDEVESILKANNKRADALQKTLENQNLKAEIRDKNQKELDTILADRIYLRTRAYYEEMLLQLGEIEATAKEGDTFETFFLDREKCDTLSALTPLKGKLIVPHLDSSLDVPMGKSLDGLNAYFASECEDAVNAILQSQNKASTYTFTRIKLVGDTRSKSSTELHSSPYEGVIHYWIVEFEGKTYHARLKEKRDEMNHEPGHVSCVFTPGSPFTKEVYNTAMDAMLRERKAFREHRKLFSTVLVEITKHSVHAEE
jgi:hypothetical protein